MSPISVYWLSTKVLYKTTTMGGSPNNTLDFLTSKYQPTLSNLKLFTSVYSKHSLKFLINHKELITLNINCFSFYYNVSTSWVNTLRNRWSVVIRLCFSDFNKKNTLTKLIFTTITRFIVQYYTMWSFKVFTPSLITNVTKKCNFVLGYSTKETHWNSWVDTILSESLIELLITLYLTLFSFRSFKHSIQGTL